MDKFERHPVIKCFVLSGVSSMILFTGSSQCFGAAPPAESGPLHDFYKTTNPWSGSAKATEEAKKTIADSEQYIARAPKDPSNYINRADSYVTLQQPKEALKNADIALSLKPKNKDLLVNAHCARGQALIQLKQYKAAIDDLSAASKLDPTSGEALFFRGMAKERLGLLTDAVKDYKLADDHGFVPNVLEVDFGPYMEALGSKIKRHWHPPKSSETKKVVMFFKVSRDGIVSNSRVQKSSGVPSVDAAAVAALKEAQPFAPLPHGAPKNVDVDFSFDYNVHGGSIGVAWENEESNAKKRLAAAESKKDEAALCDAQIKLVEILKRRGKYPEAIDMCKKVMVALEGKADKQEKYAMACGQLAMVYSLQSKNDEAEAEFKKSLDILDKGSECPSNLEVVEILKEYAKVLYKGKKTEEANKIYERLKKKSAT